MSEDLLVTYEEFKLVILKDDPTAADSDLMEEFEDRLNKQHADHPDEKVKDVDGEWLLKMIGHGKKFLRNTAGTATKKRKVTRTNAGQASFAIKSGTKREEYCSLYACWLIAH